MTPCIFCHTDRYAPDHAEHCCGRQGALEALEDAAAEWRPPPEWASHEAPRAPARVVVIKAPRETSVQAFYAAVDAGIIETRRAQVWAALQTLGTATCSEIFEHLKDEMGMRFRFDSNTASRLTELRDLGLIREVGERECRVTGRTCITWEIVPASEYAGVAVVHRCPECGQVIARELPAGVG